MQQTMLPTPHGDMIAMSTEQGLSFLEFVKPTRHVLLERRMTKWFPEYETIEGSSTFIQQAETWLTGFFNSEFETLTVPTLDMRGTDFEHRVWQALLTIPVGETMTYQGMAVKLGKPKASRAVGGASRRNPVSLIVPCHRVIGANGNLTGYGGGLDLKRFLLNHESPPATKNLF